MPPSLRPPAAARGFTSPAVESLIAQTTAKIADPQLAWLFENCFPNTLDTTVTFSRDSAGHPDTFIITGDIDAMWLRDSTNQVWPYLPLAKTDPAIRDLIHGLIRRQAACVLVDPYANAFYRTPDKISHWQSDSTLMHPGIHERKYELDSLASVLRLATEFFRITSDTTPFDAHFLQSLTLILHTIRHEQQGSDEQEGISAATGATGATGLRSSQTRASSSSPSYFFQRQTNVSTDTLPLYGHGNPFRRTGMSRSPFRPSDDSTTFQFHIPSNAFAATTLATTATMLETLCAMASGAQNNPSIASESLSAPLAMLTDLATSARQLSQQISLAIHSHAIIQHPNHGPIFAYEVDGFGSINLMDDANLPSLLSLPYLGFCPQSDPTYQNTRRFILSPDNPYFATGSAAAGIGSPHIGRAFIWPLSLITQALTTDNESEILTCLRTLQSAHAPTGFFHESFHKDNPTHFTRPWFAWANTFFGELILHTIQKYPGLLAS